MNYSIDLLNTKKGKIIIGAICLLMTIFIYSLFTLNLGLSYGNTSLAIQEQKDYIYLSDMDYITENNWSFNGWTGHEIQINKNQDGGTISLIINGEKRPFAKGIGLHARGQIVYDISELSTKYPRFVANLGVDASRGANGSIWFQILVSSDGISWVSLLKTDTLTGTDEAVAVDLNIEGYKYLKIYVDPAGSNAADHGSIANARLVTEDYAVTDDIPYNRIHKLNYYDEILGEKDLEYNYNYNYKLVLERELVNKLGYWNIQMSAEIYPYFNETMEWILNENRVLEEVIEVGEISNSPLFLKVLSELYHKYKDDLSTENGYVYEKMMIGLAAAYSTDRIISPLSFGFQTPSYDYMERFKIMKDYFDNNEFRKVTNNALAGTLEPHDWFKDYHVELMRMVMQDGTSNIDLKWLNGFTNEKQSVSFYMIGYVSPTYTLDKYYAEENRETYDNQFYLSKYEVPYGLINGTKIPRYWMVFANGGICWNASRVGQSMFRVNGIPATGAYQVGHELYIHYYEDANGNGYWTTRYGNWSGAGSTWGGANPYRYIFNWNNKYFADRHISGSKIASSTGYLYLGQDNLNHYDAYKKSLYYNLIANSYDNNAQKLAAYNKSLEVNDINLDTYDSIINVYKTMSENNEISSDEWYELALKIIDAYEYHPVAMFDLLKVIRPYLEGSKKLHIDRLERETLLQATKATGNETIFAGSVKVHANQLLNKTQPDPMTFSFDGDKGGIIVKNPIYQLAWGYSLDGGNTWAKFNNNGMETEFTDADEIALTQEELNRITSENDIQFKFMGLADLKFTIDITEGTVSNLLYANDLENRVIGVDLTYEWKNKESDPWTSYKDASPDNTGDKTLIVRRGNTGTQLASESVTYTFTADNQPNTRKYVPISHLSIAAVSTEATNNAGAATYAIDGNYNTRWHSAWNGSDTKRFITIKLDKPRYVSAVEFVPAGGGNGKIYDGTIYGCNSDCDNDANWIILSQMTNLTYTNQANDNEQAKINTKSFEINDPKEVQYIKIVADRTNGNWFTARAFNIFQDITSNERPTAGVAYSPKDPTTENVLARLVNVSVPNYEIISPGGDTHEFTENGTFTFRFRDKDTGLEGSALAKVDWIDRTAPTATIEYSTLNPTNSSVYAILKPSEDIKVINNGYYSIGENGKVYDADGNLLEDYSVDENGIVKDGTGKIIDPFKYEFIDNGEFTFEFIDKAGNKGSATAKVNWIDRVEPVATLTYSKSTLTNEDVIVTIDFNEEAYVINNNQSKTYKFTDNGEFTFIYSDLAGNRGTITAKVNWMDKVIPTAELKYEKVNNKVIVKVINPSEEITFAEGIGIYEFTRNGNYDIIFYDKAGNMGKLTAIITTFKEEVEKPEDKNPEKPEEKPEENEKPNKPNTGNNSTNPTNPNNPNEGDTNDTNPDINKPINTKYIQYKIKNIIVDIPTEAIKEDGNLKVDEFTLTKELKSQFGDLSEYYDIYLLNNNSERMDVSSSSPIKISIKLKGSKEFIGVYEITEDNTIKSVDYVKNGNNIEITTSKLGKYVVSYKELEATNPEAPEEYNNKYKPMILVIAGFSLAFLVFILYTSKKSKKN